MTPPQASHPDSLGEAHRYRLDERIATGGMGTVWRATDTVLGREVAVKVLKNEYADDPLFRTRFEAEARNAAALHHPGVASIFDFGDVPGNDGSARTRPYLVMELVPGHPLSALLRPGEPMPPETASDLVAQAADAIGVAHELGIVHRDVKPANLMVTPQGRVKITDFGIARAADGLALTNTGEVIGTPHYLSPEQAEGKPATAASDIYSLGVVLYEALAGHRPFTAASPVATALAHLREPVPPLPQEVPEHLQQVTMKALAKAPGDRFESAEGLAAALRGGPIGVGAAGPVGTSSETKVLTSAGGAAAGGAAAAGAAGSDEDGSGQRRRRRLAAYWPLVAAVAAVILVVALFSVLNGDDDSTGGNPSDRTTGPGDDRVRVREAQYVGMESDVATDQLEDLGLQVRGETIDNPDARPEGTVASVTPSGLVEPDSEVTLAAWGQPPEPEEDPEPTQSQGPEETPTQGPDQSPDQDPDQGPSDSPAQSPSESPAESPSESPETIPSEPLDEGAAEAPENKPAAKDKPAKADKPEKGKSRGESEGKK